MPHGILQGAVLLLQSQRQQRRVRVGLEQPGHRGRQVNVGSVRRGGPQSAAPVAPFIADGQEDGVDFGQVGVGPVITSAGVELRRDFLTFFRGFGEGPVQQVRQG